MLDKNAKIEQYIHTAHMNAEGHAGFDTWAKSVGLDKNILAEAVAIFSGEVRTGNPDMYKAQIRHGMFLRPGAKKGLFGKYKDSDYEDRQIRGPITVIAESGKGDLRKQRGDEDDFRTNPRKAPYRIIETELSDGRLLVGRLTEINARFDGQERKGNVFEHAYIFPAGTRSEDINGLKLDFEMTLAPEYWGDKPKPAPKNLPTLSVADLMHEKKTTMKPLADMEPMSTAAPVHKMGDNDGALSKDEIDAILAGAGVITKEESTATKSKDLGTGGTEGALSQDEIDALLAGVGIINEEESTATKSKDLGTGGTEGALSQDEIDALLGANADKFDDVNVISQDEIDARLADAPVDLFSFSQEDLFAGMPTANQPPAEQKEAEPKREEKSAKDDPQWQRDDPQWQAAVDAIVDFIESTIKTHKEHVTKHKTLYPRTQLERFMAEMNKPLGKAQAYMSGTFNKALFLWSKAAGVTLPLNNELQNMFIGAVMDIQKDLVKDWLDENTKEAEAEPKREEKPQEEKREEKPREEEEKPRTEEEKPREEEEKPRTEEEKPRDKTSEEDEKAQKRAKFVSNFIDDYSCLPPEGVLRPTAPDAYEKHVLYTIKTKKFAPKVAEMFASAPQGKNARVYGMMYLEQMAGMLQAAQKLAKDDPKILEDFYNIPDVFKIIRDISKDESGMRKEMAGFAEQARQSVNQK